VEEAPVPAITSHVGGRDDDDREVGACDQPPVEPTIASNDAALESEFLAEADNAPLAEVESLDVESIPRGRVVSDAELEAIKAKLPPQLVEDLDELFRGRFTEVSELPEGKNAEG